MAIQIIWAARTEVYKWVYQSTKGFIECLGRKCGYLALHARILEVALRAE
jgi:6-phosphofructokinase